MTREEREKAIAYGKEQLEVFGGEHAEFIKLAIEALKQEPCEDMGEVSDGYHTFNQLYHQRAILFATIVNQNKDIAWKSYKHSDGKYCFDSNGEWFIVGIDTPEGSYTYHYKKEYWDYFECKELECGKEWDGHTEEDVTRLLSLKPVPCDDCVSRKAVLDLVNSDWEYEGLEVPIDSLPSVKPAHKKGHWIESNYEHMNGHIIRQWYCSECGSIHHDKETGEWREVFDFRYAYCPLCGIEMENREDNCLD